MLADAGYDVWMGKWYLNGAIFMKTSHSSHAIVVNFYLNSKRKRKSIFEEEYCDDSKKICVLGFQVCSSR